MHAKLNMHQALHVVIISVTSGASNYKYVKAYNYNMEAYIISIRFVSFRSVSKLPDYVIGEEITKYSD